MRLFFLFSMTLCDVLESQLPLHQLPVVQLILNLNKSRLGKCVLLIAH